MMAFVRGVSAASTASGFKFHVCGSMSANTGRAPTCTMVFAVAQNVSGVVITSCSEVTSDASSDKCSAAVHELSASAWRAPT